jgi:hypothetical protein
MRNDLKLAAFCVQRRAIAAAIFIGTHLAFSDIKNLDSDHRKAETTAIGFANWILEGHDIDTAALEAFEGEGELMRAGIYQGVVQALRSQGVSLETIPPEFLNTFAHPSKVTRKDARVIVANIWPILTAKSAHPAVLDAVAVGLYSQTDRLLQ